MTTFPGSPRLLKGAIVALSPTTNIVVSIVPFQYNPESLSRTLQVQALESEGGSRSESLRIKGPPIETLKLDIEIDATDQLEKQDPNAIKFGIYPQLSALEILVYPKSNQVQTNMIRAGQGQIEIIPLEGYLTLLVWGKNRVQPVRLTDFNITEEAYDVNLNPIRAKVSLGLRVLSYDDLPWGQRSSQLFMIHHKYKEWMAAISSVSNLSRITGVETS